MLDRLTLLGHVVAELQQNAGHATELCMLLVHPTVLKP